jgi:4-oxalocrotonate tautomerase
MGSHDGYLQPFEFMIMAYERWPQYFVGIAGHAKRPGSRKGGQMPHIIVKLYPGRSEAQKTQLAEKIVEDVVAIANCKEKSVSVAIEEIRPEDWAEKVYRPDILERPDLLYRKPGYNPFE